MSAKVIIPSVITIRSKKQILLHYIFNSNQKLNTNNIIHMVAILIHRHTVNHIPIYTIITYLTHMYKT